MASTKPPTSDRYAAHQGADDREAVAGDRLSRVHGAFELHAALLALLLPAGSKRAARAYAIETRDTPGAEALLAHVGGLSGAARLPWFERLVERMAKHPAATRKGLLEAARRLMRARGVVRPLDRLHWLAMRRGLGEPSSATVRADSNVEVAEWLESDVQALAAYSSFLARMVPEDSDDASLGTGWYQNVMSTWQPHLKEEPDPGVDSERMVEALQRLQTLSWMQRPFVVRSWVAAALKASGGVHLGDGAADALRLTCQLLESPLPPELARHFIVLPEEPAPPGS